MLSAKHGVITEDRFRNMTDIQWYFHYKEIMKNKEEKDEMFLSLLKVIKMAGIFGNSKIDIEPILNKMKMEAEGYQSLDEMAESAMEYVKNNKSAFPETIMLNLDIEEKKSNVPKGRIDKTNKGITIISK